MITRQHMTLVLLSVSILFLSGISSNPWGCLAVILGACIGTIVPDIQMKKPKRLRLLTAAWVLARVTRHTFVPISLCYRFFLGIPVDSSDKRITHSIPGMLVLAGFSAGLAWIPMVFLTALPAITLIPLLVLGFTLGLVLHMVQDLCTKKGITPLYPFRSISVSGSIRPCIVTDARIGKFQIHHCGAAACILGIQYFSPFKGPVIQAVSVVALALCLGLMIRQSDVVITHNPVSRPGHDDDKKPSGDPGPYHSHTAREYHRVKTNPRSLLKFVEKSVRLLH